MESELNSIITGIIADVALESGATVVSNPSLSELALVDYETYVGSIGDSYLQLLDEEDVSAEPEGYGRGRGRVSSVKRPRSLDMDVRSQLKKNPEAYQKFKDSCFGRYLEYCKDKNTNCLNAILHAMLGQQVKRVDVSEPEALWFRVRNKFLRFSKYEYALVTGLRLADDIFMSVAKTKKSAVGTGAYGKTISSSRRSCASTASSVPQPDPRVEELQTEVTQFRDQMHEVTDLRQQLRESDERTRRLEEMLQTLMTSGQLARPSGPQPPQPPPPSQS
ncbi:hypothetical protein CASFOL_042234 [Castilleja foliolosa]|uniref:Uncharacterized protein n=1 Tax=Castilleja foliolosa TaxID=1961234 RepID=A0ABD3B9W1_9LAMI